MSAPLLERLHHDHEEHSHRSYLFVMALARGTEGSDEIRRQLATITDGLTEHIAIEERIFLPWLVDRLPERAAEIKDLGLQHVEIANLLDQLRSALAHPTPALEWAAIETAKRFIHLLDGHTQAERHLTTLALAPRA